MGEMPSLKEWVEPADTVLRKYRPATLKVPFILAPLVCFARCSSSLLSLRLLPVSSTRPYTKGSPWAAKWGDLYLAKCHARYSEWLWQKEGIEMLLQEAAIRDLENKEGVRYINRGRFSKSMIAASPKHRWNSSLPSSSEEVLVKRKQEIHIDVKEVDSNRDS